VELEHSRRRVEPNVAGFPQPAESSQAFAGETVPAGDVIEAVPDDVRSELREATGVDVATVHRGPEVSKVANQLGAVAFTTGGEVFVPREVGPLHHPPGRAVVAHEVMHASQQRRSGSNLPREDTPAGAALEAHAQAAERYFRGDPGAPRPRPDSDNADRPEDADQLMRRLVDEGFAVSGGVSGRSAELPLPPTVQPAPGVQRQTAPATAPTRPSSSTPAVDWNPIASFGHTVARDLQAFGEQVVTSEWGLSSEVQEDMTRAANAAERDFAQNQYRQLRLEHRKSRFLTEHHQTALSLADEHHIERLVEQDVTARLAALQDRVERRLLSERDPNGEPVHVIDREEFRTIVSRLFGDASTDTVPPDDASGSAATSSGGRSARGSGAERHTPGAGHPRLAASATATTGLMGVAAVEADHHSPTVPGGPNQPDGSAGQASPGQPSPSQVSAADSKDPAGAAGTNPSTRRELTVGEGFRHLAADVVADVALLDVGEWGVNVGEEEWRQLRRDLHDPLAAATPATPAAPTARGADTHGAVVTSTAASAEGADGSAPHHTATAGIRPIGPAPSGQATASPTGHEHMDLDHLDLDELSDRLYGRLRRRLRTELLVDRERAGLLTDFR
jgi:hypothetical protein